MTSREPSPHPHRLSPPATAIEYGKSVSLAWETDCSEDLASKAFTVLSAPAVTTKLLLADPAEMILPTAPFPLALTCAAMSQAQPLHLGSHLQHIVPMDAPHVVKSMLPSGQTNLHGFASCIAVSESLSLSCPLGCMKSEFMEGDNMPDGTDNGSADDLEPL